MARWLLHPPSWFGRLHSLKMNILPKILYLFCTLLVALVQIFDFSKENYIIYLGEKRPRVSKHTLYAPRRGGGLRTPDLLKYFYAAQLAQLAKFHSTQPHPIWMQMEAYACQGRPIVHILWLTPKERPPILCPALSFSMEIWNRLNLTHLNPSIPLWPLFLEIGNSPWISPLDHSTGGPIRVFCK